MSVNKKAYPFVVGYHDNRRDGSRQIVVGYCDCMRREVSDSLAPAGEFRLENSLLIDYPKSSYSKAFRWCTFDTNCQYRIDTAVRIE